MLTAEHSTTVSVTSRGKRCYKEAIDSAEYRHSECLFISRKIGIGRKTQQYKRQRTEYLSDSVNEDASHKFNVSHIHQQPEINSLPNNSVCETSSIIEELKEAKMDIGDSVVKGVNSLTLPKTERDCKQSLLEQRCTVSSSNTNEYCLSRNTRNFDEETVTQNEESEENSVAAVLGIPPPVSFNSKISIFSSSKIENNVGESGKKEIETNKRGKRAYISDVTRAKILNCVMDLLNEASIRNKKERHEHIPMDRERVSYHNNGQFAFVPRREKLVYTVVECDRMWLSRCRTDQDCNLVTSILNRNNVIPALHHINAFVRIFLPSKETQWDDINLKPLSNLVKSMLKLHHLQHGGVVADFDSCSAPDDDDFQDRLCDSQFHHVIQSSLSCSTCSSPDDIELDYTTMDYICNQCGTVATCDSWDSFGVSTNSLGVVASGSESFGKHTGCKFVSNRGTISRRYSSTDQSRKRLERERRIKIRSLCESIGLKAEPDIEQIDAWFHRYFSSRRFPSTSTQFFNKVVFALCFLILRQKGEFVTISSIASRAGVHTSSLRSIVHRAALVLGIRNLPKLTCGSVANSAIESVLSQLQPTARREKSPEKQEEDELVDAVPGILRSFTEKGLSDKWLDAQHLSLEDLKNYNENDKTENAHEEKDGGSFHIKTVNRKEQVEDMESDHVSVENPSVDLVKGSGVQGTGTEIDAFFDSLFSGPEDPTPSTEKLDDTLEDLVCARRSSCSSDINHVQRGYPRSDNTMSQGTVPKFDVSKDGLLTDSVRLTANLALVHTSLLNDKGRSVPNTSDAISVPNVGVGQSRLQGSLTRYVATFRDSTSHTGIPSTKALFGFPAATFANAQKSNQTLGAAAHKCHDETRNSGTLQSQSANGENISHDETSALLVLRRVMGSPCIRGFVGRKKIEDITVLSLQLLNVYLKSREIRQSIMDEDSRVSRINNVSSRYCGPENQQYPYYLLNLQQDERKNLSPQRSTQSLDHHRPLINCDNKNNGNQDPMLFPIDGIGPKRVTEQRLKIIQVEDEASSVSVLAGASLFFSSSFLRAPILAKQITIALSLNQGSFHRVKAQFLKSVCHYLDHFGLLDERLVKHAGRLTLKSSGAKLIAQLVRSNYKLLMSSL